MKYTVLIFTLFIFLTSCHDKVYNKFSSYEPVYTDLETFRTPVTYDAPKTMTKKGNIYFKDDYLFMVEPNEGIHIIDNSNPSSPVTIGFLNIMGCSGLAIKGDILYVTALIDLVTIDISNISSPQELSRVEDAFPTALPLMEKNYPTLTIDKNKGVVTSWNVVESKEETNNFPVWQNCPQCVFNTMDGGVALESSSTNGSSSGTGTAGSITKLTIVDDHLFVIDNWRLRPFDITDNSNLIEGEETYLWWDTETVFPYDGHLFMGTTTGMMIYNIDNPNAPYHIGQIAHMRACDPVVVQDDYAYVTVRSGGSCGGDINQLDIVNITDNGLYSTSTRCSNFYLHSPPFFRIKLVKALNRWFFSI